MCLLIGDGRQSRAVVFPQIDDRVSHELSGAVKSHVATAIAFEYFNSAGRQRFGRSEHVGGLGIASERDDGRVLEEKEDVSDLSGFAKVDQPLLQAQAVRISDHAKLNDGNHRQQQL
jgi:hypothetical protein